MTSYTVTVTCPRLYHQAEAMIRHYKTPILLIEFDPARSFSLQSTADLGDDIDPRATMSRLVLLVLHFPKLRCVHGQHVVGTYTGIIQKF